MAKNNTKTPKVLEWGNEITAKSEQKESLNASLELKKLENAAEKGRRGWLGAIWGDGSNSAINIAGILIIILVVVGAVYTFVMLSRSWKETHSQVLDFWEVIIPLITLALGYLFGKRQQ